MRYAHWLDSGYIKIAKGLLARPCADSAKTVLNAAQRILKLYALFGTTLILSDNQLTDSQVIFDLFRDESFRLFLKDQRDFLKLKVSPLSVPNRFDLAASGLHRSKAPGWISSTFSSNVQGTPTPQIAEIILTTGPEVEQAKVEELLGNAAFRRIFAQWPEDRRLIEGMVRAFYHFAAIDSNAEVECEKVLRERSNLYKILCEMRGLPLTGKVAQHLDDTLSFIENKELVPEGERHRRSIIFQALDGMQWSEQHKSIVRHTVTHAYNIAIQENLGLARGSIPYLPDSVPIHLYRGDVTDALFPIEQNEERFQITKLSHNRLMVGSLAWDPGSLSWDQIRCIRRAEKVQTTTRALQRAFELSPTTVVSREEIQAALRAHVAALAQCVQTETVEWPHVSAPLVLLLTGVGCLVLGSRNLDEITVAAGIGSGMFESIIASFKLGERYLITDTLSGAVERLL